MATDGDGRQPRRAGFATRLFIAQALVLVAGATTSWLVAVSLGPGIFSDHLRRAGVPHTPAEAAHVEQAFASAMVLALVLALIVSLIIALAVTWFLTRRVQRSINAVTSSAQRIATGDYRIRIPHPGLGVEFDQLTATINQLAERLETVEQTRRRMLSDLAHEMRTPLATIDAHLEAIEDGLRSADPETMTVLRSSSRRLSRLAQDIGAVSKAEEGQLHVDLRPIRVADLVRAAINAARPRAQDMHIDLVENVKAGSAEVLADPERMGQVLGNLLDNAIWHSPPGSSVTMGCRLTRRQWVELSVADEGAGVAREHIGHLFDRFYRADTADNRAHEGSGIGLTIARTLVEAHNGQIWVTSPGLGEGATFVVRLPACQPAGFTEPSGPAARKVRTPLATWRPLKASHPRNGKGASL